LDFLKTQQNLLIFILKCLLCNVNDWNETIKWV
jgi:hypothetical protein